MNFEFKENISGLLFTSVLILIHDLRMVKRYKANDFLIFNKTSM